MMNDVPRFVALVYRLDVHDRRWVCSQLLQCKSCVDQSLWWQLCFGSISQLCGVAITPSFHYPIPAPGALFRTRARV